MVTVSTPDKGIKKGFHFNTPIGMENHNDASNNKTNNNVRYTQQYCLLATVLISVAA